MRMASPVSVTTQSRETKRGTTKHYQLEVQTPAKFVQQAATMHVSDSPVLNRYLVNRRWWTTEDTKASFWDSSLPGAQDGTLDDVPQRVLSCSRKSSMWEIDGVRASTEPRIILVTAQGSTTRERSPLRVRGETLQYLIDAGGFDKSTTNNFLHNCLPFHHARFEYDDSGKPMYMTVAIRLPRHRESTILLLRTHLSTFNTFAFLACNQASDCASTQEHLLSNASLLRRHPLHFVSLIYQTRYRIWIDRLAALWSDVAEIESLTKMTRPDWVMSAIGTERHLQLSNVNKLMAQLYSIRVEMDHSRTVMAVEKRFRAFCVETMEGMEARRGELGWTPNFGRRERAEWDDMVTATGVRFDAAGDRVVQLRERLQGQIEVVYNMIARRNSEVALTVAQLQAHDSRMVKGIAIMTMVFLPATVVSTIWTTDMFHLEGDSNWQFFVGALVLLTVLVVLGWTVYVQRAKKKQEKDWRTRAQIDNLNFSMA
ncbi:hypothetical protein B0T18DRAFT_416906 [Schizothecium vesticola]|uniref:Cora-domain-containing protein n=1 Tax=Schizothecium vesticola TaxID=314040 RepID=A0AA40ERL4_9PEZI|nr:hypothetical protein B0T18DRAFT_416906 [Schizothecium vesticola]